MQVRQGQMQGLHPVAAPLHPYQPFREKQRHIGTNRGGNAL